MNALKISKNIQLCQGAGRYKVRLVVEVNGELGSVQDGLTPHLEGKLARTESYQYQCLFEQHKI